MTIGDVNSKAVGSGARYNDGKPDLSLIPAEIVARILTCNPNDHLGTPKLRAALATMCLGDWQRSGDTLHLYSALSELDDPLTKAARVFTFGAKKYAAWNWAKGMAWSIPLACALRHAHWITVKDQIHDDDSGHEHEGHLACNIIMLIFFAKHFPQGNDITYSVILPQPEAQAA